MMIAQTVHAQLLPMTPKLLSHEQKERRKELCLDLLQRIENERK
jgi:hypothetical protein